MNHQQFYKKLGELLYAVAAVDGKVQPKEINRLKQLITDDISTWDTATDKFGTDASFYTEFEFETLVEDGMDFHDAYRDFIDFAKMHHTAFTPNLVENIISVALKVANAFNQINKTEINLILKLKKDLSIIHS